MSLTLDTADPLGSQADAPKKRKRALSTGEATSRSLSSRPGRMIVYFLMFIWTVPTFGILVSSFRPEVSSTRSAVDLASCLLE